MDIAETESIQIHKKSRSDYGNLSFFHGKMDTGGAKVNVDVLMI